MKMNFIALFTIIFFAGTSCQEKIDIEKEKEAIIAVIETETDAFLSKDFERLAATYVQDETNIRLSANKSGYNFYVGWEELGSLFKEYIENNPDPSKDTYEKTNYKIKVYMKSAWVINDETVYDSDGEIRMMMIEVRFLEKVNGEWRIVYLSVVDTISYDKVEKNIQTSAKYHKLDPEDINDILTDDFIGRNEKSRHTWDKESHKNYWSNNPMAATDTIYHQIADGNWIATRFLRKMNRQGKEVEGEVMHFKRFENGKIAEIWEYGDSKQLD